MLKARVKHHLIHSVNKHFLIICYFPDTGDGVGGKTKTVSVILALTIWLGRQTLTRDTSACDNCFEDHLPSSLPPPQEAAVCPSVGPSQGTYMGTSGVSATGMRRSGHRGSERVKTPSLPFSRDAIIPAPTVPVGAVLDSTQGIFTVPQPLCLLTRAPWGQIGLKDQRPREESCLQKDLLTRELCVEDNSFCSAARNSKNIRKS
nr:uncharacterized protein LOC128781215 [Desmodus rotundus]